MELKQYISLFRKWIWLLLLGALLGGTVAYGVSIYQQPVYQTKTRVMVMRPPEEPTNQYNSIYNELQLIETYSQLITTGPVLEEAGKKLGYEVYEGQISVRQLPDSLIFEVAVTDGDPAHAAQIANSLVDALLEYNDSIQDNRFSSSEESLQAQIDQVESQITTLQDELSQISNKTLDEQLNQVDAQIANLEAQISPLQDQIIELMIQEGQIEEINNSEEIDFLNNQIDQLNYSLRLYKSIRVNLEIFGEGSSSGFAVFRAEQLQNSLNLYQQIYANLLNNYENIRLSRLRSTPNVLQIDTAPLPIFPIRPQPIRNAVLGAVVGFFIMGGIAFLIEYLDDTLKTPEDINLILGLPVIGMIGKMGSKQNGEGVYVADNPRSPVAESYRTLRTNLEFASVETPLKTLLVTSADPTSGKSTVAANLAVSIAQGDRRVALVDADLRRPALHKILRVPNRVGLSDLFRSQKPPPYSLRKWGDPPTLIMTSGSLPPNPTELLGTRKMEQILADLEKVTDLIILDSPPFIVSDPIVLSAKVDGVLLVIKPGSTRTEVAQSMLEQLQRAGARVVGVVLNPISLKERGYYNLMPYGYGVSSDGDQPKKDNQKLISRVKPTSN